MYTEHLWIAILTQKSPASCIKLPPMGKGFEPFGFPVPGEGNAAGEEHGGGLFIPGAVFMIAHQGKPPGGELHPDLMAAAGMEPDAYQALFAFP